MLFSSLPGQSKIKSIYQLPGIVQNCKLQIIIEPSYIVFTS